MSNPNRGFLAFFVESSPIKFPPPKPQFRLHLSHKNQALDAPVKLGWISPGPASFFSVERALLSFPGRAEPGGEFALFSSTRPWLRFVFWCSESRKTRPPVSFTAAVMAHHRAGIQEAGRPAAGAPEWIKTLRF